MYDSISSWKKAVKEDCKDIWKDGKVFNKRVENWLIILANFILIFIITDAITTYLGNVFECIQENKNAIIGGIFTLWQIVPIFLKSVDLRVAERFSLSELTKFKFQPSVKIYYFLLVVNSVFVLIKIIPYIIIILKKIFIYGKAKLGQYNIVVRDAIRSN